MARRSREHSSSPASSGGADDDGELGSADLTLHILAKAHQRGLQKPDAETLSDGAAMASGTVVDSSGTFREAEVLAASPSGSQQPELEFAGLEEGEINNGAEEEPLTTGKKKKKKKAKKAKRKEAVDMHDSNAQPDDAAEVKLPDAEESLVMRKLLRGPRYFDPPDEQRDSCYNCGQVGHRAADCPEQPRQKPCYICSNFGHEGHDCPQRTECFECGKLGHIARSCPNKQSRPGGRSSAGVCLLCGRVGHDASKCFRDYDLQDFKQICCYICKRPGHLCCVEIVDASPTPISCYQCGHLGHSGVGCMKRDVDDNRHGQCFNCGQEGHIARDCNLSKQQRRHSWPAPWPADYDQSWKLRGRYGDQDMEVTSSGQYGSGSSRHQERLLSSESGRTKRNLHLDNEEEPVEGRISKRQRRSHMRAAEHASKHQKLQHD